MHRLVHGEALRYRPVASRLLALASPVAAAVIVAACGGAGPPVEGPVAQELFADYTATWLLDTLASESMPDIAGWPEPAAPGGGRFGGVGPPGGGRPGGGRMPPSGIGGRAGGGMLGPGSFRGPDPESVQAMQRLMEEARQRPERITLALDDSLFSTDLHSGAHVILPIDGERVQLSGPPSPVTARLGWDGLQPRLERIIEKGGTIVDLFEVVDRTKLIVIRRVEVERGRDLRFEFIYRREGAASARTRHYPWVMVNRSTGQPGLAAESSRYMSTKARAESDLRGTRSRRYIDISSYRAHYIDAHGGPACRSSLYRPRGLARRSTIQEFSPCK